MKGTVYTINSQRGMVAVQTTNGDYSVFELLGSDMVETGDEVQWNQSTFLGSTQLMNITQSRSYEVYFQNHCVPKSQLSKQLLID